MGECARAFGGWPSWSSAFLIAASPWVQKKAGRASLPLLLAAFAVVPLNDLAEGSGFEVEIALDGEASGAAHFFHLGEDKIAPLLFMATNVAKEPEVFLIRLAFGGKPSPVAPGTEELDVLCSVASYVLLVRIATAESARQALNMELAGLFDGKSRYISRHVSQRFQKGH